MAKMEKHDYNLNLESTQNRELTSEVDIKIETIDDATEISTGLVKTKTSTTKAPKKQYKCKVCYKSFPSPSKLKRHERVHTGEKPFTCAVCDKGFTQKHHLQYHERIHTGVKLFTCAVCNKGFTRKDQLQRHERTHDEPSKCTQSPMTFSHSNNSKAHGSSPTGELKDPLAWKSFTCAVCDKGFNRKHHLLQEILQDNWIEKLTFWNKYAHKF